MASDREAHQGKPCKGRSRGHAWLSGQITFWVSFLRGPLNKCFLCFLLEKQKKREAPSRKRRKHGRKRTLSSTSNRVQSVVPRVLYRYATPLNFSISEGPGKGSSCRGWPRPRSEQTQPNWLPSQWHLTELKPRKSYKFTFFPWLLMFRLACMTHNLASRESVHTHAECVPTSHVFHKQTSLPTTFKPGSRRAGC